MADAGKQGIDTAVADAWQAVRRARALLDDVSERYAEDIANVDLDGDDGDDALRTLSDAADMLRDAGEHLAAAEDELAATRELLGSV